MADEIIQGMAEFNKKLNELDLSLQRKALIEVAKEGARILLDASRQLAPRLTGALADGLAMRVSNKESDIYEGVVDVGADKKTFYAHMQEFGTRHHSAQPFIGPALEENRERILAVMRENILRIIDKVAK